jgi:hypothetical protein
MLNSFEQPKNSTIPLLSGTLKIKIIIIIIIFLQGLGQRPVPVQKLNF